MSHQEQKPSFLLYKKSTSTGKTHFSYDSRANLIEQRLPNKETISYEKDLYENPTQITNRFGTSVLEYNASGNLVKHTNVAGEVTTLEYDTNENLIQLTDIHGDVTTYSYNAQDKLIEVAHPDGNTESYAYFPQGRLLSYTDIHRSTTHYTTDKADNLVEIDDAGISTSNLCASSSILAI